MSFAASFTNSAGSRSFGTVRQIQLKPGLDIPSQKVSQRHGQFVGDEVTLASPDVSFVARIKFGTTALTRADMDDLLRVEGQTDRGKLYFNTARYLNSWIREIPIQPLPGGLVAWDYRVEAFADDPFWYDATADQQVENKSSQPWNFSSTNGGKAIVYPVFTVLANGGTNLTSIIITNNTTGKVWTYTGTVLSGNSIVFGGTLDAQDRDTWSVLNNGVADLANVSSTSVPIWLNVGANSMTLSTNANCRLTMDWRERYYGPAFD